MRSDAWRAGAWKPDRVRRPLAFGLAAVVTCALFAPTGAMTLDERVAQCAECHGADGNSETAGIPSLAGQQQLYLLDQLIYMREGVRPVEAMAPFVKGLDDSEIVALAKRFSGLTPKASDEPVDSALVERGAKLAERLRCHSCHGAELAGHEQIPRLAKQRIDYLIRALKEYRGEERRGADSLMTATVVGLSDADLRALAHYAASR